MLLWLIEASMHVSPVWCAWSTKYEVCSTAGAETRRAKHTQNKSKAIINVYYLEHMIILSILLVLLSNAVNIRRDLSILFNRIAILILVYCILQDMSSLALITKGIGLHGGLLLITNISQMFHIFIFLVSILILQLTSFYPRKV